MACSLFTCCWNFITFEKNSIFVHFEVILTWGFHQCADVCKWHTHTPRMTANRPQVFDEVKTAASAYNYRKILYFYFHLWARSVFLGIFILIWCVGSAAGNPKQVSWMKCESMLECLIWCDCTTKFESMVYEHVFTGFDALTRYHEIESCVCAFSCLRELANLKTDDCNYDSRLSALILFSTAHRYFHFA